MYIFTLSLMLHLFCKSCTTEVRSPSNELRSVCSSPKPDQFESFLVIMRSCPWVAGVHPVQSTHVLRSLSTDTSWRCFLGYVNTEHCFSSDLHIAFHALPRNAPCPRDWRMTMCPVAEGCEAFCVLGGGGIMASFCSTNRPLPIPVLLKLGLEISWHGVAASRILITSPFSLSL